MLEPRSFRVLGSWRHPTVIPAGQICLSEWRNGFIEGKLFVCETVKISDIIRKSRRSKCDPNFYRINQSVVCLEKWRHAERINFYGLQITVEPTKTFETQPLHQVGKHGHAKLYDVDMEIWRDELGRSPCNMTKQSFPCFRGNYWHMDNGETSQTGSRKVQREQKLNLRVYGYDLRPGTCGPLRLIESRSTLWNITTETRIYHYVAEVRHRPHYSQGTTQ